MRGFLKGILNDAALFLMQSEQDAARLLKLGVDSKRVVVAGNMKYDLAEPPASPLSAWLEEELARTRRRPVLIAGSVVANEETLVLQALGDVERAFPDALLILAPRKPERFHAAAEIVEKSGRKLLRRSDITLNGAGSTALAEPGNVLLLDSLGELAGIYRLADAVFVGGSLVPGGGHNILEPAAFGRVPVYGPSMDNFREVAAKFLEAGAGIEVSGAEDLGAAWRGLLTDTGHAARMGACARELVDRNRGGAGDLPVLDRRRKCNRYIAGPRRSRQFPPAPVLCPLSVALFLAIVARVKSWCLCAQAFFKTRRLAGTVVSVGNLTVGGTGKTPMVLWIAERLAQEGKHVAILTRGYRGTADAGEQGEPQSDEVALLRERLAGKVKIGVGADRYKNGNMLAGMESIGSCWMMASSI